MESGAAKTARENQLCAMCVVVAVILGALLAWIHLSSKDPILTFLSAFYYVRDAIGLTDDLGARASMTDGQTMDGGRSSSLSEKL